MRMTFEGKQPGKIGLNASIGTAQSFVGEVGFLRERIDCFLVQEVFPSLMPLMQPMTEAGFIGLLELLDEMLQLFACVELWFAGDVAKNDLHLMELAHLNGNVRKG